jgi:hypothetical protein
MPPSLTEYPSVITVENTDGFISSVIFSREFFLSRVAVCNSVGVPSVVGFFYFRQNKRQNGELPTISIATDGFYR